MPPRVHTGVKYSIELPLFHLAQDRLQLEVERHFAGAGLAPRDLASLSVASARWRIVANKAGFSYVCAVLKWSDGAISRGHYRIPYRGRRQGTGGLLPNLKRQVDLDKGCSTCKLSGVRAGLGDNPGGSRRSGPHTRPEIGLGFARRAQSVRSS